MEVLHRACRGEQPPVVIGLVDGPDRIEAAVCIEAIQHWYSEDWFWIDRFLYVHPSHRKSRHAVRLLRFTCWWSDRMGVPVVMSIETLHQLPRKVRLYSRFGRLVGASFVMGRWPVEEQPTGMLS